MAPSCLFVAAKLEEFQSRPRLMRDIILIFDRIMKRREGRPLVIMECGSKVSESKVGPSGPTSLHCTALHTAYM